MLCWNCEKQEMAGAPDLGVGWLRCPNCGATWIEMPKLSESALGGTWSDEFGYRHYYSMPVRRVKKAKKEK